MDSGNSNSMQSSSGGGGDEEYDSRAESISSFLNNNNNNPSSYPPPPAPAPAQHRHHTSLFDPLSSNYTFDPLSSSSSSGLSSSNPNCLLNLDMVWSKSLRSDPNCIDQGGLFIPSTSSSFSSSPALHHIPRGGVTESVPKASSFLAMASGPGLNIDQAQVSLNNNNSHHNNSHNHTMVRNPKKRSRASRRAPTTVLTTDTTNFRAMVQEFTGIPAPPFTSSSTFPRTRLDLFGTSPRSTAYSHYLDSSSPTPSYNLLRPFAQKHINPINPFTSSSSMIDAIASAATTTATTTTATNISNYQLLPSQNILNINMQSNPILNLHSLLQGPPKYPLANSTILETKPPLQGSSLEELGLSHAAAQLNTNLMSGLQSWPGAGTGTGAGAAAVGSNENHEELGVFGNGKLSHFSQVASSEFHRDKGQENVNVAAATTTRSEGMVESWICSSD